MDNKPVKKIGLWNIVGLGVGGAIGSGIFVTLGSAIAATGRSILPITVICVFYMLFAYWYNLAMSGIFIINGGDYSMKGMLLPPLLTGYGGWTNVIWAFGFTGYALSLTSYLSSLWPILAEYNKLTSSILLTVFFLLTIRGNRIVTLFQNLATLLLIGALVLFVVVGIPNVDAANFFDNTYDGGFFHNGFAGMISAIAIMGWACQGTTMGPVGVVPITKNPKRTIPMGIIVTCVVVSIVYGLMSYVAAGVLPYDQIAGQNLSVTANAIMSHGFFAFFVIGGGVCAIISSFLAVLAMIREPLSHMADDGWLPAPFRKKTQDGYPYLCFLMVYIVALVPILTGMSVDNAITMLMIPTMLINAYLNTACIIIPKKYPEQFAMRAVRFPRWLYSLCSILGGFCALVIAVTLFQDLTAKDAIVAACIVIIPLIFSAVALKTGSVDARLLDERKAEIVKDALKPEE
ncbi:MAG TPA: APC family permease [Candidatus Lachnoclostridium stercoravium]|uniref:APC family permease n=1 Tax=Candidatus Lachnoclostridium stercoravium TaxID=2838633 RepID=A0A9D2KLI3_9FIRM|nr:APC family permease [Candidatus Lachnoclostridium stercoravium]